MADSEVLILFAHPALQNSRVNKVLIEAVMEVEGVTVHDLYEEYPDFAIDVKKEQSLLLAHSFILFHHPLFWYSTPALLKEWQDLVLQHGWAYGHDGTALRGKKFFAVLTTGGSESAYQKEGYNRFTIRELLAPIEQTWYLCGIEFLPPFVVHGTLNMKKEEILRHATEYRRVMEAITTNTFPFHKTVGLSRLNQDLESLFT
ncbi:NAD(P)H-dependent oxidoreductase [candidate division CSSED10-310 bacterium]|uniref:NAD(P)H-dependent oxidoreductase n=1 Tax=candidate division CSSED10-310 bacterium TaxID=2855610 RepID=A0ABV6Z062_UNCC1